MSGTVKKPGLSRILWDLLFPAGCVVCGRPVPPGQALCPGCREKAFSPHTRQMGFFVVSPFSYVGGLRSTLHRFKFQGKKALADPLGRTMAELVPDPERFDGVTWVPISKAGKRARGYDQSELLARAAAKALGLPTLPLLEKARETDVQHRLSREARQENVKGAYRAVAPAKGLSLILVDDIVTTGATLRECAGVLCAAGAKEVFGLCAADAPKTALEEEA